MSMKNDIGINGGILKVLISNSINFNKSGDYLNQIISKYDNQMIPPNEAGKIIESVCFELEDLRFGLRSGLQTPISALGTIGQIYFSCEKFSQVLEKMELYVHMLDSINKYEFEITDDFIIIKTIGNPEWKETFPIAERQVIEHNIGFSLRHKREYLCRDIKPIMIWTPYKKEGSIDLLETFFSCPIYFEQPYMAVFLPKKMLDWKIPTANQQALSLFESLLNTKAMDDKWYTKVKTKIEQHFKIGIPSLDLIAKQFFLSERNLQRLLKSENTNFKIIMNQVKIEYASYYLKETNLHINEISDLLGFSMVNSFHRFYKTHKKITPNAERKAHRKLNLKE